MRFVHSVHSVVENVSDVGHSAFNIFASILIYTTHTGMSMYVVARTLSI